MSVALGLGSTQFQSSRERKSISVERTFAGISAVQGFGVWQVSRVLERIGTLRTATVALVANLAAYVVMAIAAVGADGVPAFGSWGVTLAIASTAGTSTSTTLISLALEPMERIAGTAAAVRGVLTLGVGSLLAAVIDRQIETTITPMAVGGAIYCAAGLVILQWARGGSLEVVDPDAR